MQNFNRGLNVFASFLQPVEQTEACTILKLAGKLSIIIA